jgi:hypothetical protein
MKVILKNIEMFNEQIFFEAGERLFLITKKNHKVYTIFGYITLGLSLFVLIGGKNFPHENRGINDAFFILFSFSLIIFISLFIKKIMLNELILSIMLLEKYSHSKDDEILQKIKQLFSKEYSSPKMLIIIISIFLCFCLRFLVKYAV